MTFGSTSSPHRSYGLAMLMKTLLLLSVLGVGIFIGTRFVEVSNSDRVRSLTRNNLKLVDDNRLLRDQIKQNNAQLKEVSTKLEQLTKCLENAGYSKK
ncbi:hypothetical protein ACE1CI_20990 [Aerosakkonemataceae cyanobacterium BLCC-F50]|uniref:Uncharacterized protein n=1 Tax=Floridaenema flaviceps BLCC-F50 TaxID=3153642 RepID=A0ABV4XUK7_9CYAN